MKAVMAEATRHYDNDRNRFFLHDPRTEQSEWEDFRPVERLYDRPTGKHYWYNLHTQKSKWEEENGRAPAGL